MNQRMNQRMNQEKGKRQLSGKQLAFVDFYVGAGRFNATAAARLAGYKDGPGLRETARRALTNADIAEAIRSRLAERAMAANEVLARLAEQARSDIQDVITIIPGGVDRDKWVRDLVSALKGAGIVPRPEPVRVEALPQPDDPFSSNISEEAREAEKREAIAKARTRLCELLGDEPQEPGWRVDLEKAQRLGVTHLIHKIGYDKQGRPELELHDSQAALVQLGRHHALFVDRSQVETPEALGILRQMLGVESDSEAAPDAESTDDPEPDL